MAVSLIGIILVNISTFIGGFGALLFKKSSKDFRLNVIAILKNKSFMLAIFLYLIATVLTIPAMKGNDLSIIYPMTATSYIWVAIFSKIFLKEKIKKTTVLGIALIILGVVFLSI